ncbi:MAG: PolC-type DNA polymerase III [Schwartzia sp.]|nr:PolC-type DNA polymerase III [Schwartzia sp. (in: firmicutes)]
MQQKYRLVPRRTNTLWTLVRGMTLTADEEKLVQSSFIKYVEVSPHSRTWEILLETRERLDRALLLTAAHYIEEQHDLDEVIFYQNVLDLAASLAKTWRQVAATAASDNPLLRSLLSQAERRFQEGRLLVRVGSTIAGAMLEERQVAARLQQAMGEITGCYPDVVCECCDGEAAGSVDSDAVISQTDAYKKAMETAAHPVPEAPPKGNSNGRGRRKKAETAEDCVFGSGVAGEVTSIEDITNERKNVVIAGRLESVSDQKFEKTNMTLLKLEIADTTQGILAKVFFRDQEEFGKVRGQLKQGQLVRVRGTVRFDTYEKDLVLMAESLKLETAVKRADQAQEKRVELHAHTKMSLMDAVVSAKDLIKTAASWGWPAIAITDHGVVQAFPEAMNTVQGGKLDIKVIYGMEGYLVGEDYKQKHANHIILLAKNRTGLFNLYRLVSLSHLRFFHKQPRIPKKILAEYREGLIVGSACEAGELIRAIVDKRSDEALLEIARFYDYLEIQPVGNNAFLVRSDDFPDVKNDDDLRAINLKVAELAKKLGKMLIATGDVHFLNPEDAIYRAVIMAGHGFTDADLQPPLWLKTTEEMLEEFRYLGEELAYDAVVRNPQKISDMVERLDPMPEEDKLYSPMISGAAEQIRELSYQRAHEMYGENLPEIVQARLDQELKPIIGHGFSVLYLIAHKLVHKSNEDGYLVGSRGSVGSSFIATMTDITEVNPLPPHWRCPDCKYSRFVTDGSYASGFDLPDKDCPVCGTPLIKDGHDIPFAVFLGFDGDKVPDIDLNFASVYQARAQKYTTELFGRDNAYRAGTIATVADRTALGFARKYYEERGQKKRNAFIQRIANGCMGVKRTTGQHPAGVMIVPRDMDIHFFSPIQRPANKADSDTVTTHFDYHSISGRIVKLDNLGHDDPTVIKMLEELTHRDPKTIPFDDPATLSLFHSTEALGLTPEELGATSGTFGIPEFRTSFTRQMIDDTHPSCFSDLVRISGFSHGTDVWLDNAQALIRAGTCTLQEAISGRDDIMLFLIRKGIDPLLSFKTMEKVRKGKGIDPEVVEKLRAGGVPEWYIESCQKIKYLFPRAHATAYVMMAYRIAFCKVHYPLAFYAAYFSIRADAFDVTIIAGGKDSVRRALDMLQAVEKPDDQQKELIIVLQLAWEMYLRGYAVEHVDLYRSDAEKFILLEKSLLPPFTSMKGFGAVAARSLVKARKEGTFTSMADLRKRTSVTKTGIELLKAHGCLEGLPESDQLALF